MTICRNSVKMIAGGATMSTDFAVIFVCNTSILELC